jgi:hypothetical protein
MKKGNRQTNPRKTRSNDEGNILWQKFRELGKTRYEEFMGLLACNAIALTTFYADTYADRDLSRLPQKRMRVYQAFFTDINFEAMVEVTSPTQAQKKKNQLEKKQQLASKLKLSK